MWSYRKLLVAGCRSLSLLWPVWLPRRRYHRRLHQSHDMNYTTTLLIVCGAPIMNFPLRQNDTYLSAANPAPFRYPLPSAEK